MRASQVTVTAGTPLVKAETASLGAVIDERETNEIPLNGRNPMSLAALVPGVVPQGQSQAESDRYQHIRLGQLPDWWRHGQPERRVPGWSSAERREYAAFRPLSPRRIRCRNSRSTPTIFLPNTGGSRVARSTSEPSPERTSCMEAYGSSCGTRCSTRIPTSVTRPDCQILRSRKTSMASILVGRYFFPISTTDEARPVLLCQLGRIRVAARSDLHRNGAYSGGASG